MQALQFVYFFFFFDRGNRLMFLPQQFPPPTAVKPLKIKISAMELGFNEMTCWMYLKGAGRTVNTSHVKKPLPACCGPINERK